MKIEGIFTFNEGQPNEFQLRNSLLSSGAEYFLRTVFRGEAILPANFYIGLTSAHPGFVATLASLAAGEPTTGGYARIAAARGTSDWTVTFINGAWRARSKLCVFTASGDWVTVWRRVFLCDASSGTVGNAFALSGPAEEDQLVLSGAPPSVVYDLWMRA